ncbi:hypothetical protein AB6A40_000565 [Gnathostoma spinigerum]|uniref:Uncharacterized protein n=1 Tax=Gnathostoma spinigerum TaxID=75299 RepID=A0ABD6E921_9BILA
MDVGDFGDVIVDASTLVEEWPEDQPNFFRGMDIVSKDLSNIRRSSSGLASRSNLKDMSNDISKIGGEEIIH